MLQWNHSFAVITYYVAQKLCEYKELYRTRARSLWSWNESFNVPLCVAPLSMRLIHVRLSIGCRETTLNGWFNLIRNREEHEIEKWKQIVGKDHFILFTIFDDFSYAWRRTINAEWWMMNDEWRLMMQHKYFVFHFRSDEWVQRCFNIAFHVWLQCEHSALRIFCVQSQYYRSRLPSRRSVWSPPQMHHLRASRVTGFTSDMHIATQHVS